MKKLKLLLVVLLVFMTFMEHSVVQAKTYYHDKEIISLRAGGGSSSSSSGSGSGGSSSSGGHGHSNASHYSSSNILVWIIHEFLSFGFLLCSNRKIATSRTTCYARASQRAGAM